MLNQRELDIAESVFQNTMKALVETYELTKRHPRLIMENILDHDWKQQLKNSLEFDRGF